MAARAAAAPLKELGADPVTQGVVTVREGRFGPYVTDGETNASLRKGDDVESITIERAAELLADRRARGPATKKKAAKKTTAKKTAAKKAPRRRRRPRRPRQRSGRPAAARVQPDEAESGRAQSSVGRGSTPRSAGLPGTRSPSVDAAAAGRVLDLSAAPAAHPVAAPRRPRRAAGRPPPEMLGRRRLPGYHGRGSAEAIPLRATSTSRRRSGPHGSTLRAGRKSASTPQWISAPPERNQAPPRAARTGGFWTSVMPSTPP